MLRACSIRQQVESQNSSLSTQLDTVLRIVVSRMSKSFSSAVALDMAYSSLAVFPKHTARRSSLQARTYFPRARRAFSSASQTHSPLNDHPKDVKSAREYCSQLIRYARSFHFVISPPRVFSFSRSSIRKQFAKN